MSGEYVKARVDNPTVTTVTIGYGGTGASASVGAPGGTTSFGNTIIAKGGLGGNVLAEGTAPGVVGPYGAYTEPGFTGANIIGSGSGYSSPGVRYSGSLAMGGPGGDSILGAGAGSQAIVGEGINANGHGGGGGGACVYGGATQQRAGGSGMAGIAIIWGVCVMNYAVIENGVVTNIAVWDGESAWQPTNALVIPVSDNVRIGWFYDKGKLSSPTQPPKTHDELLREAENERQCLLDSANGLIMNWQSDLLLGIISENNKNNLLLWKEYVNNLMSVDLSLIPEITWPERPEIIR